MDNYSPSAALKPIRKLSEVFFDISKQYPGTISNIELDFDARKSGIHAPIANNHFFTLSTSRIGMA